jgi:hypothetical protein
MGHAAVVAKHSFPVQFRTGFGGRKPVSLPDERFDVRTRGKSPVR